MPVLEALAALAARPGRRRGRRACWPSARRPGWSSCRGCSTPTSSRRCASARRGSTRDADAARDARGARGARPPSAPLVLVLEDLHWADASTLDLIGALAAPARARAAAPDRHLPARPASDGAGRTRSSHELACAGGARRSRLPRLDAAGVGRRTCRALPRRRRRRPSSRAAAGRAHGRQPAVHAQPARPLARRRDADGGGRRGHADPPRATLARRRAADAARAHPRAARRGWPRRGRRAADRRRAWPARDFAAAPSPRRSSATARPRSRARCAALARRAALIERARRRLRVRARPAPRGALRAAAAPSARARCTRRIGAHLEDALGRTPRDLAAELGFHFVAGRDPERAVRFLRLAARARVRPQRLPRGRSATCAPRWTPPAGCRAGSARTRAEVELLSLARPGAGRDRRLVGRPRPRRRSARPQAGRARCATTSRSSRVLLALATLYELRGELARAQDRRSRSAGGSAPERRRRARARGRASCWPATSSTRARSPARSSTPSAASSCSRRGRRARGHYSTFPATLGDNAGVSCHDWAGLALWFLGQPDPRSPARARARAGARPEPRLQPRHRARAARGHPPVPARARGGARVGRGDDRRGRAAAATPTAWRWAACCAAGRSPRWATPRRGSREIAGGLAASRGTGARMDEPHYLGLLGDAHLRAGDARRRAAAASTRRSSWRPRERSLFYEPELLRLRGTRSAQRPRRGARRVRVRAA